MVERMDYVELTSPGQPPVRIPLDKARMQIGRSSGCDLRLSGSYVSRRHARLERSRENEWRVIDQGSANGTYLNGRRTEVGAVGDGDVVGIGTHRVVLHLSRRYPTSMGTETGLEIMPTDGATIVGGRVALPPDRVVSGRLLTDLHEASRRLGRSADISALLRALAQEFRTVLRPARIAIGREDGPKCVWPIVVGRDGSAADGSDLSKRLAPRVETLEGSIAVSLNDLMAAGAGLAGQSSNAYLFPVKAGDRRLGHVYVELERAAAPSKDQKKQLLSLLCRQAGFMWENLELQVARRSADEMHREIRAARQIQLRLFPERLDLDPALDVAAENVPALNISGDYYDCQLLEPGRVLFIVADVMGHGLPSALVMSGVQAVFRTGVRAGWTLTELDRYIHEAVASSGEDETFVSGVLGVCDVSKNRLSLLSAGHPWPSIWCGSEAVEREKTACTGLWGVSPDRSPKPATVRLPARDWSIVAYTDGVSEAVGPDGCCYGTQRVSEVHHQHRASPADEICEEILTDVQRCSDDSAPQDDDITLLVFSGNRRA